jgi:hypothetical protein
MRRIRVCSSCTIGCRPACSASTASANKPSNRDRASVAPRPHGRRRGCLASPPSARRDPKTLISVAEARPQLPSSQYQQLLPQAEGVRHQRHPRRPTGRDSPCPPRQQWPLRSSSRTAESGRHISSTRTRLPRILRPTAGIASTCAARLLYRWIAAEDVASPEPGSPVRASKRASRGPAEAKSLRSDLCGRLRSRRAETRLNPSSRI